MEGMKKLFLFALFLVGFSAAVQAQNLQVKGRRFSCHRSFCHRNRQREERYHYRPRR